VSERERERERKKRDRMRNRVVGEFKDGLIKQFQKCNAHFF